MLNLSYKTSTFLGTALALLVVSAIPATAQNVNSGAVDSRNDANSTNNIDSRGTGVGVSENNNVNVPVVNQDFAADNSPTTNNVEGDEYKIYSAPDNLPPAPNQYKFGFTGQNSNQKLEIICPSGGGVSINIGSYLGGFGVSTPSDQLPSDCNAGLDHLPKVISTDNGVMASQFLGGEWQRTFYEEMLIQSMIDLGYEDTRTGAVLKLQRMHYEGDTVSVEDLKDPEAAAQRHQEEAKMILLDAPAE